MNATRIKKLCLAVLIAAIAGAFVLLIPEAPPQSEMEKKYGQPPTKEFIQGFDAGVRYGLIARIYHPEEDSIPKLTDQARYYWWLFEKGGWQEELENE